MLAACPLGTALGNPVLSEFLASNQAGLRDGDGLSSDWIEIHNGGTNSIDLAGWHLTDNPDRLTKWTFPSVVLPSGGWLVVFASDPSRDDYVDPEGNLHVSFKLSSGGEYLALVAPDGETVVSALSPSYPTQYSDVSYGVVWSVGSGATTLTAAVDAEVLVPTDDALGLSWTTSDFVPDPAWTQGPGYGVGYDLTEPAAPAGLIAGWGLDDPVGSATAADATGNEYDGQPVGGVTFGQVGATPETGTCAAFNNGGIDVSFDPALNPDNFTFAAWVRPSSSGSGYRSVITSRYDSPHLYGYILYISPDHTWQFWTGAGGGQGWKVLQGPEVTLDAWTHAAISFDQATQTKTLFINGESVATATDQGYIPNTGPDLHLGSGGDLGDQYRMVGEIDDAVLWNDAVNLETILRHRDDGLAAMLTISYDPLISIDVQSSMYGVRSSCYIRMPFDVADPAAYDRLTLRMQYDDGFTAFLNGTPIAARNAPDPLAWDAQATALRPDEDALDAEVIDVTAYLPELVAGTNVLAVQGLNRGASSSDFLVRAELEGKIDGAPTAEWGYFQPPSPGAPNPPEPADPGPHIEDVSHPPGTVALGENLVVSATVSPRFAPVQSVDLRWRVMYGAETTIPMRDDGVGGDPVAGDGIYTGVIQQNGQPGDMVRYFLTAEDAEGATSRFPAFLDRLGVNQSPEYRGTVVHDPGLVSALPIMQWFTDDVPNSQTRVGSRASLWFNDEFYDNIHVRQRGQATAGDSQKFNFNRGDSVYINETLGRVGEVNMNTRGADPDVIRQPLAFQIFGECDVASSESFPVLMHRNGSYHRVGLLIEQVDEDYLRRHGFDDQGVLYKMVQRYNLDPAFWDTVTGVEKKTREEEDFSDIDAFIDGIRQATADQRARYLFDHVNLPQFVNYMAAKTLIRDVDSVRKNFYFYRDAEDTGEWSMFPWDEDFTFGVADPGAYANHIYLGDSTHKLACCDQWNVLFDVLFTTPETAAMYHRRLRTLMDTVLLPPGSPAGSSVIEQRAEALAQSVQAYHGVTTSGVVNWLHSWRNNLFVDFGPGGVEPLIPPAQEPSPPISIGDIVFNPVSRNQDEEYVELVNPGPEAVDISGWTLSNAVSFTFQPGTVIPGGQRLYVSPNVAAFRSRTNSPTGGERLFVQGNYQGHLSNFGETLSLRASGGAVIHQVAYEGDPTDAQLYLRISELHFHPRAPDTAHGEAAVEEDEFEFVELINTSGQTLDLSGAAFTEGILFTFPEGSLLAPGARTVVVRNQAAFETRYGAGLPVAGEYTGRLDDGGETVKLRDRDANVVHSFTYEEDFTLDGDGNGPSTVVVDLKGDYETAANWMESVLNGGSPGAPEPERMNGVVINEVLSHTDLPLWDSIELLNLSTSVVDLGGWFLGDAASDFRKYEIPTGTTLAPGAYLVLDEREFNPTPANPLPHHFALNSAHGDDVWLVKPAPDGRMERIVDHVEFGAAANGESFGRWLNGDGSLYPQTARSLGETNPGPRVGPVVITEIMYHPTNDLNRVLEFIEIHNPTETPELLDRWLLTNAVTFACPPGQVLGGGETLVVVGFDPMTEPATDAAFRAAYGIDSSVLLAGPFTGRLDNAGEGLQWHRPDTPPMDEPGFYPLLLEDEVLYDNRAPWPEEANGGSFSLTRVGPMYWGNDPESWTAAPPSPGRVDEIALSGYALWRLVSFPPGTPSALREPMADPNRNQRPNVLEYAFGFDPVGPGDGFGFEMASLASGRLAVRHLRRIGASDLQYTVCLSPDLVSWDESETFVVEVAPPVPTGDGIIEEVQLEVDPAAAFPGRATGFVRVRVALSSL